MRLLEFFKSVCYETCIIYYKTAYCLIIRFGNGSWSSEGITTQMDYTNGLNSVECSTQHLTTFAVLINNDTTIDSTTEYTVSYSS